jgi:uncharacterized Ntn-hydrolase superfamily protein
MTFSIVARSPDGSLFGVAIASSSPAVAARCAYARAGVGAVATQNITNPALGPAVLSQLERAATSSAALDHALEGDPHRDYRQLLGIGRTGPAAIHSGAQVLGVHAEALGENVAAAGNLLARKAVPAAAVRAFEQARGDFGARLMMALHSALEAGGEAGPIHSAGLLIVRDVSWPIVDLRVDWTESDPIAALFSIWEVYAPQIEDYVRRAHDPTAAPSFNVPGDRLRNHRNDV